jgi:hypothetical protein
MVYQQEVNRKCDLMDKNFSSESRSLRAKAAAVERENEIFKDKVEQLENQLRVCIFKFPFILFHYLYAQESQLIVLSLQGKRQRYCLAVDLQVQCPTS